MISDVNKIALEKQISALYKVDICFPNVLLFVVYRQIKEKKFEFEEEEMHLKHVLYCAGKMCFFSSVPPTHDIPTYVHTYNMSFHSQSLVQ